MASFAMSASRIAGTATAASAAVGVTLGAKGTISCKPQSRKTSSTASTPTLQPFHLAVPVHDLGKAKAFYGDIMQLTEGRSSASWQDYSLFGHQFVCHCVGKEYRAKDYFNPVDSDNVPVPHFGVCLSVDEFHALAGRLQAAGISFIIEPHLRFEGQAGEQYTMFFKDPSGNSLEFKAMTNPDNLFAKAGTY